MSESSHYLTDFQNLVFIHIGLSIDEQYAMELWDVDRRKTINLIDTITEELLLFPTDRSKSNGSQIDNNIDCLKVFIVHGHDETAKNEVARFIEQLDLEAVILHEQANSGSTIIEKLEKHTDVGFAIVLYTACDVGGIKAEPDNLKPRARQNVVFEHGLLIGKIGRKNVVALVKENIEIPGDISGMVYELMDSGKAWKFKLGLELKESGYDIDMNKIKL